MALTGITLMDSERQILAEYSDAQLKMELSLRNNGHRVSPHEDGSVAASADRARGAHDRALKAAGAKPVCQECRHFYPDGCFADACTCPRKDKPIDGL